VSGERVERRTIVPRRFFVAVALVLVATLAFFAVGTTAYRAGVARGVAESGKLVGPEAGHFMYPYPPYPPPYWGPPFGFGFGGFLFPLLFLFLLFGAIGRRRFGPGCGPGRHGGPGGVPPFFEEWHRRAHESMTEPGQKA
jgi:hypothetical protein